MTRRGCAIGIDLGTTYCCVGLWRNDKVEIVPNAQGNRTTPSVVSFTDTDCLVGEPALNHISRNLHNTVFNAKRLIGRRFSDPVVQNDIKLWPFKVVSGVDDTPIIVVEYKDQRRRFSAEEISSMILANLKETAEAFVGSKVTDAVVAVPAHFNNAQRQATKTAGTNAGLNVMRVINEPTAAAIAYELNHKASSSNGKKNFMIFDLGGGTFDVSVLSMDEGELKVMGTAGNSHLGGEDFDSRLVNYCVKEFNKRHGKDMSCDERGLRRLRTACEKAKRILSYQVETVIDVDSLHDGIDFQISISAAKFDELNMDLFKKCMELVDQCVGDADLSKRDIQEVVLVGGSSRILKIQELLRESFPNSNICKKINPDEAIAHGAAINAAMLSGESSIRFEDVKLQDVTPLSLGLGVAGGVMSVLIPKHTPIPVKKEKFFTTSFDKQTVVKFTVFEGERTSAKENNLLGVFELSGLPQRAKLSLKIMVSFDINADGILIVSAKNPVTNVMSKLTIARESGWLSSEISDETMTIGVERRRNEGTRMREERREKLESYARDLRNMISGDEMKKKLSRSQKMMLGNEIGKALSWMSSNRYATSEAIDTKIMDLEKTWSLVISQSSAIRKGWKLFICLGRTGTN